MSVQDPFVLNHNTTSNVNERMRGDIEREFRRASIQCRNLVDIVDAQHAGIVELLSSPSQTADENTGNVGVHEETAHFQSFLLRLKDPAIATAVDLVHGAVETEHRVNDAVGTVSWHRNVVGAVVMMLADIFDVDCVIRDQPSEQFDVQLSRLSSAEADRGGSSSVLRQQLVGNLAEGGQNSQLPVTGSAALTDNVADDSQLNPHHKRQLHEAGCNADEDTDGCSDGDLSHGRNTAKRHKTSDSTSDGVIDDISRQTSGGDSDSTSDGGIDGISRQTSGGDSVRHILLSVDCSARSRLWVGRKKVRRQFMHIADELKRQLEVSSALRNEVTKSDHAILEFELAVVRPRQQNSDELVLAVLPSKKTSKEFGCFMTFFVSLIQKLINNITIEGPVML